MSEAPALRRLLVVDPCDDCHRLLPGLRSVCWDVDSCSLENAIDRTCDVGLLRLQPFHLERPEAVEVAKKHLMKSEGRQLTCPDVYELCQRFKAYDVLAEAAKKHGDVVHYLAGRIASAK